MNRPISTLNNMDDKKTIYTVGYTLFQTSRGLDLEMMFNTLRKYGIRYLIDVRSVPYSKQYPQCNADSLKVMSKHYGVPYGHMPELGAKVGPDQDVFSKASDIFFDDIFPISKSNRPEKTELQSYEEIVDFRKFRNEDYFISGLKRVEDAYDKGFTLALMCSEKNPIDCHRYFLVSKKLEERFGSWLTVRHIIQDKVGQITTVTNSEIDRELSELILKKSEVKRLDLLAPSFYGPAKIDNYFGETQEEKINDFCDRYWNLMHGWKKTVNTNSSFQEYD